MALNSVHYLLYRLGLAEAVTQTSLEERRVLRTYAEGKNRLVEIGAFHGVNTRSFREVMSENGTIIAVDPYIRTCFGIRGYGWARRIAHREVNKCRRGTIIWAETLGADAIDLDAIKPHLPVDFLFIDGDHSYNGLKGDWEAWSGHLEKGGIVALHDSRETSGAGSETYTNQVILNDDRFEIVALVDSLTCLRRW